MDLILDINDRQLRAIHQMLAFEVVMGGSCGDQGDSDLAHYYRTVIDLGREFARYEAGDLSHTYEIGLDLSRYAFDVFRLLLVAHVDVESIHEVLQLVNALQDDEVRL